MIPIEIERRNAALLKALRDQTEYHKANPDEARKFLMSLGCWNEDGTLKEEWGGEPQGPTAETILAEIIDRWNDLKRDEGAFPAGDRRAAMSEHRLWHSIQQAKAWLHRPPQTPSLLANDPLTDRR